jgi:hydrogenase nickel incorporation protein HypA/HybF
MHELGIAQNILEIVQQSVPPEQAPDVRWVRMRIGPLSGVVPDSLDFCFSVIIGDTAMPQARLAIEQVPLAFRCKDCRHEFQAGDLAFKCPACGSSGMEMIAGKELEIVEIELAEPNSEAL